MLASFWSKWQESTYWFFYMLCWFKLYDPIQLLGTLQKGIRVMKMKTRDRIAVLFLCSWISPDIQVTEAWQAQQLSSLPWCPLWDYQEKNAMGFSYCKSPLLSSWIFFAFWMLLCNYISVPPLSVNWCGMCTLMFMYLMLFYSLICKSKVLNPLHKLHNLKK